MAHALRKPAPKDHVLLGVIGSAHGIKGEVSITSYTADPADVGAYGPLTDGARTIELVDIRATPKTVLARVNGVTDRNGAEALRNTPLYVPRARLPVLADEEGYYVEDLKGLTVVNPKGEILGVVVDVANFGAGDLIEVRLGEARDTIYVAFNSRTVPQVDLDAQQLTLIPPDDVGGDQREEG